MRQRIFGAVGVLWGGAILIRSYRLGGPLGSGAYLAGQMAALGFAALLLLVGAYYLVKGKPRS